MKYNEKEFATQANKKAMIMWLVMMVVLSAAYVIEVIKGDKSVPYFIWMELCAWVPFIEGVIVLKIKGWHNKWYRDICAGGYWIFFAYIMFTSPGTLAFAYVFPLLCMLVVYKDKALIIRYGVLNVIILAITIVRNFNNGMNSAQDITHYEMQFGITLFCYIGLIFAIQHLSVSDSSLLDSVKDNLSKVITTIQQVKTASNAVVDGVTVVRELSDENKHSANEVVDSMTDLARQNDVLSDRINSSINMTEDIDNQVENVAELVEHIMDISQKSSEQARESTKELESAMASTNSMAELSTELEAVLHDFQSQFEKVKVETGTISEITNQTNLLALNASIEAARAGDAGRGFAVVAEEIRNLSVGTQSSSDKIMEALKLLADTSEKMTQSITTMLELISENLEKMQTVNTSVENIAEGAMQLGDEIQVVDSAMKQVQDSNKSMVNNMHEVQDIMEIITESAANSKDTTTTMLSKYDETARNVINIEVVVGKLVEELGTGGFMSLEDLTPGMKVILMPQGTKTEYSAEVAYVNENRVAIKASSQTEKQISNGGKKYEVHIVVNNAIYIWNNISVGKQDAKGNYLLKLEETPKVINRRKYPRLPMGNTCEVVLQSVKETYRGKMVNISAGGFAFAVQGAKFADAVGENIQLRIDDFLLLNGKTLNGVIIRSSNNNGTYVVGCRMLQDNVDIQNYVNKQMNIVEKNE